MGTPARRKTVGVEAYKYPLVERMRAYGIGGEPFSVVAFLQPYEPRQSFICLPARLALTPQLQGNRLLATEALKKRMRGFEPLALEVVNRGGDLALGPCAVVHSLSLAVRHAIEPQIEPEDLPAEFAPRLYVAGREQELVEGDRVRFRALSVVGDHPLVKNMIFANVQLGRQ